MAGPLGLKGQFNRSAPAYEPELWNDKVSDRELTQFLDQHRAAITKILDVETGRYSANELQNWPLERTRTALDGLNKAIETLGSDERVAGKYGLTAEDIRKIRPEAERLYHDQGYQAYANCYTYAMNDRDRYSYGGDSPGQRASAVPGAPDYPMISMNTGSTRDYEEYKRTLIKGVEADGAIIGGKDAEAIEGYYRVAVYALPPDKAPKGDNPWTDMHFARENRDGGWSHKAGSKPVTDKDNDGRPITDPKTANLGGYEFLTFVYVPEGGLDVGHGYEPKTKPASVDVPHDPAEDWKRRQSAAYPEPGR